MFSTILNIRKFLDTPLYQITSICMGSIWSRGSAAPQSQASLTGESRFRSGESRVSDSVNKIIDITNSSSDLVDLDEDMPISKLIK